jgi:hypothetical protein
MYIFARSGSSHAINAETQKLFSNLEELAKCIIENYHELSGTNIDFKTWIERLSGFRVYQVFPDSNETCKKLYGKNLIDQLSKIESVKVLMVKEMLKK